MRRWHAAIAAAAVLAASASTAAAQEPTRPFSVRAVLPAAALSAGQAAAMVSEVESIWAPLGVRIQWRPLRDGDDTAVDWTVAIDIRDRLPLGERSAPQPLGAIMLTQGQMRRLIFVSRGTVESQIAWAGIRTSDHFYNRIYGRFVGRVIAHELGHLLLDSTHHRDRGLMRPRFEVSDVLTGSRTRYAFDAEDLVTLRERVSSIRHEAAAAGPNRAGTSSR